MTTAEATKLASLIRNGSLNSAVIVIKYLSVMYRAKHGIINGKPVYTWLPPNTKMNNV